MRFLLRGYEDWVDWKRTDGEGWAGSTSRKLPVLRSTDKLCISCALRARWWSQDLLQLQGKKIPTTQPRQKERGTRGLIEEDSAKRKPARPMLGIIKNQVCSLWPQSWDRWSHFCFSPCSYWISTNSYGKRWVTAITCLYSERMWSLSTFLELPFYHPARSTDLPCQQPDSKVENQSRCRDTKWTPKV